MGCALFRNLWNRNALTQVQFQKKNLCILGLKQLSSNSEPIKVIRLRATLALQRLNPS